MSKRSVFANMIEIYLIEASPIFAAENKDLIGIEFICAKAGDIEFVVRTKYQTFGPMKMFRAILGSWLVGSVNIDEPPRPKVKTQHISRKWVGAEIARG